ncbi:hypothetical protein DFJ74DRAFT_659926 [Hyaloraphidium curvatum]|nr:hypothetical protein DFJ74DRAFT_659926 [Hyaloraphidium curvatum]
MASANWSLAGMSTTSDARLSAPWVARNRDAILAELARRLPSTGTVLEVACGSGEHTAFFASKLPRLTFLPTDLADEMRASADAWARSMHLANVLPSVPLDASDPTTWPITTADAVLCINMIHVAPWAACLGLFAGAAKVLGAGAPVILYGPFMRDGRHTSESNEVFDGKLKERSGDWGVRDLKDVAEVARSEGFGEPEVVEMPANNLVVVFRKTGVVDGEEVE